MTGGTRRAILRSMHDSPQWLVALESPKLTVPHPTLQVLSNLIF